jgi:hypothetical protein
MIVAPHGDLRKLELRFTDVAFTLVYLGSLITGSVLVWAFTNAFRMKKLSLRMN